MVLTKEYRICMPITTQEYKIGQLYMIARHSLEQSGDGEGVEIIENMEYQDPINGCGQFTEKRIHLSNRLPTWIKAFVPKIFYITEKAWNYYPFTITEYTCSFLPRFHISIQTKYEDNNGSNENCLNLSEDQLNERLVDYVDIAYDPISESHSTKFDDPKSFKSKKTDRGPLTNDWRLTCTPIMCSYKLVNVSFEIFGLQTRMEDYIQSCIRDILLVGHRQAFVWIDEWIDMNLDDVRDFENEQNKCTNLKLDQDTERKQIEIDNGNYPIDHNQQQQTNINVVEKKTSYFSWF